MLDSSPKREQGLHSLALLMLLYGGNQSARTVIALAEAQGLPIWQT
jgi:hypothetical protein